MAIVVRTTKGGETRYVSIYRNVDNRQSSAGTFGTRKAAERAYTKAKALVLDGIDPTKQTPETEVDLAGEMTVGRYAATWMPRHKLAPHTRPVYESTLRAHILPRWKDDLLARIRTSDLQDWFDKLEANSVTWETRARIKKVMSAMFTAAAREPDTIPFNPIRGVGLVNDEIKPDRPVLSPEQYEDFRGAIPEHYQLLTDFVIEHGGLRWEEAMALQAEDIDPKGLINIRCTLNELFKPHRHVYRQTTKTRKSRVIKVEPEMCQRLLEAARTCRTSCKCGSQGKYVFLNPDGSHIELNAFRKYIWKPALAALGLENSGLTMRDMRHVHATWLKNLAEVDWEVVRDRLGHSSIVMTQKYVGQVKLNEDKAIAGMAKVRKQR